MRRPAALNAGGFMLAILLAGCSETGTVPPPATDPPRSTPASTSGPLAADLGLAVIKDGRDDLVDEDDRPAARPRYVDIRRVEVETSGGDLILSMTLDAAAPRRRSSSVEALTYLFVIDTTGDREWDYWIGLDNREDGTYVGSLDDWVVTYHYEGADFDGSVVLVEDMILGRVPLSALGSPRTLAVCAITQSSDPLGPVGAEDNAPDGSCLGGGPMERLK